MKLIHYELKKLFCLPALWVFLVLCLIFNGMLIYAQGQKEERCGDFLIPMRDIFNEISETARRLGQRVDDSFLEGLSDSGLSAESGELMRNAVAGEENRAKERSTFAPAVTEGLSQYYQSRVRSSPTAVSWMRWKYRILAGRSERLADSGAACDLYAGPVTSDSHQFLFGTLFRSLLGEAAILSMLASLYLLGYERSARTEEVLLSSRRGRKIFGSKVLSGLLAVPALYGLLAVPALGIYFALWDYGGVWAGSVSSRFNDIVDLLYRKPFLAWGDFTVAGYLAAALALGAALAAVFSLLASLCGMLVRNTYGAALLLVVLCFGSLVTLSAFGELKLWAAYLIAGFCPASLWAGCDVWFTEGGLRFVLPWQETVGTAANLAIFGAGAWGSLDWLERKDVK